MKGDRSISLNAALNLIDANNGILYDNPTLVASLHKLLSELPSATDTNIAATDTISRAVALKGLEDLNIASFYEENEHSKETYTEVKAMLKALPSAQQEIIRCKDCKYSDTYPPDADNDMPLKCLGIRYGGVMPDWYCEHAERVTQ